MIVLYQIGLFPIYHNLFGVSGSGVAVKRGWTWDNPLSSFSGMEGGVSLLPLNSALISGTQFSVDGNLLNTPDIKMGAALNRLKSMAGRRNIKLIGMQIEDRSDDGDSATVELAGDITWLECNAVLTDVKTDSEWGAAESSTGDIPISLSFEILGYWKHLSPLYWEYRHSSSVSMTTTMAPIGGGTFIHPVTVDDLEEGGTFYLWKSSLSDMSPTMWGQKYSGHLGGNGSDFIPFGRTSIFVDPSAWQNVNSLYAFTGLVNTETVEIVVTSRVGQFQEDTYESISSLDLADVDATLSLLGYSGLRGTDILYTGIVDPLPGYIVREGVQIANLALPWQHENSYPGEAVNGLIDIEFRGSLGSVAYLHDFLVY